MLIPKWNFFVHFVNFNSAEKYAKRKKTKIVERIDKTKKLEIGEMKRNRDAVSSWCNLFRLRHLQMEVDEGELI